MCNRTTTNSNESDSFIRLSSTPWSGCPICTAATAIAFAALLCQREAHTGGTHHDELLALASTLTQLVGPVERLSRATEGSL
jgi:hypothetical protein